MIFDWSELVNFLIFRHIVLLWLRIWISLCLRRSWLRFRVSFRILWTVRVLVWTRLVLSFIVMLNLLLILTAHFFILNNVCKIHFFFQTLNSSFGLVTNTKNSEVIVWIILLTIFFNFTASCYFLELLTFFNWFFWW